MYETSQKYHLKRHLKQSHSSKDSKIGKAELGKAQICKKAKNIIQQFLGASSDITEVLGRNLLKDNVIKKVKERSNTLCEGDLYDMI